MSKVYRTVNPLRFSVAGTQFDRRIRLTDEMRADIRKRFADGATRNELAALYMVNRTTIGKAIDPELAEREKKRLKDYYQRVKNDPKVIAARRKATKDAIERKIALVDAGHLIPAESKAVRLKRVAGTKLDRRIKYAQDDPKVIQLRQLVYGRKMAVYAAASEVGIPHRAAYRLLGDREKARAQGRTWRRNNGGTPPRDPKYLTELAERKKNAIRTTTDPLL